MTYREPTADDIGKIVEVSHHPEGHPNCKWQAVTLLDVRKGLFIDDRDGRFQASKKTRIGKSDWFLMPEYFWRYARIKVNEPS